MASAVERKADNLMDGKGPPGVQASSDTFTREQVLDEVANRVQSPSSSYTLADDRSQFSRDVDRWMTGTNSTESAAVQGSRAAMIQRSVLARSSSLDRSGLWWILAMVLPLFSMNSRPHWSCTPRSGRACMVLDTAELLVNRLSRVWRRARAGIRQFAQDRVARELFATAMDVVLVIYAMGFLVISIYQAATFA